MSVTESLKHVPEEETRLHEMVIEDEKPGEPRLDIEEFIGEEEWEMLQKNLVRNLTSLSPDRFNACGMCARILSEEKAQKIPLDALAFEKAETSFRDSLERGVFRRAFSHAAQMVIAFPNRAAEFRKVITEAEREAFRREVETGLVVVDEVPRNYVLAAREWKILFPARTNEIGLNPSMLKYIMPKLAELRGKKSWPEFLDMGMAAKMLFQIPYKDFGLTQGDIDDIARGMGRLRSNAELLRLNVETLFRLAAAYKVIAADKVEVTESGIHLTEHAGAGRTYKTEQPPRPVRREF